MAATAAVKAIFADSDGFCGFQKMLKGVDF